MKLKHLVIQFLSDLIDHLTTGTVATAPAPENPAPTEATAEPPKATRGRPRKTEAAATPEPAPAAPAEPEPEPTKVAETPAPAATSKWDFDSLKALIKPYVEAGQSAEVKQALAAFGAEKLSALEAKHHEAFVAAVKKIATKEDAFE